VALFVTAVAVTFGPTAVDEYAAHHIAANSRIGAADIATKIILVGSV